MFLRTLIVFGIMDLRALCSVSLFIVRKETFLYCAHTQCLYCAHTQCLYCAHTQCLLPCGSIGTGHEVTCTAAAIITQKSQLKKDKKNPRKDCFTVALSDIYGARRSASAQMGRLAACDRTRCPMLELFPVYFFL